MTCIINLKSEISVFNDIQLFAETGLEWFKKKDDRFFDSLLKQF